MRVLFTLKSANRKTGPLPVSYTEKSSCPSSCPFRGAGCYAELGFTGMYWNRMRDAMTFSEFCEHVRNLPAGRLWRHNVAGDLPGVGENIDEGMMLSLVAANLGKRGFTYTHKPPRGENAKLIAQANMLGFTVNLSANNLGQADEYSGLHIGPVVVALPQDPPRRLNTPAGRVVAVCPAIYSKKTCATCELCYRQTRPIIGFPAHGARRAMVSKIVSS